MAKHIYLLKDKDGFPYTATAIEEYTYDNYFDALRTAKDWCYEDLNQDLGARRYFVDIIKDGEPYQRVKVEIEYKERVLFLS